MSILERILLCFDDESEYFRLGGNFLFLSDLENFNRNSINELLINIISNTDKIEKEINRILENIEKKYKKTESIFFFEEKNLREISDIFYGIHHFANEYALTKQDEKNEKISNKKKWIADLELDIMNHKNAIKTHSVIEEDEFDMVGELMNKHKKSLPYDVYSLWFKESNTENNEKSIEEREKELEDEFSYIKNYILSNYADEWYSLANENISSYSEMLKSMNKRLKKYKKELKEYEKEYETIYYDSYVRYLNKILYSITYIKTCVNAWFGIGYEDIDEWSTFSKEQRLYLQYIYSMPWENGMKIPESKILYAIKKDTNIILLNNYANDQYKKNKGKPFINIMNNIKKQELIFLYAYECKDLEEVINVLFYRLINSNCQVNICQNCGKYFIPKSKSNEKYCDRISPQNPKKTCKEYGVNKTYREEVKSNSIKYMHNNIGQAYRMRIKRAKTEKEKEQHTKQFEIYKTNYLTRKEKYNNGKLTEENFLIWLEKQREELMNSGNKTTDKE